ncbi:MAG: hypothetical protein RB288_02740 [Bacteroidales bacterium]|jgi:hypothetical protein|nr:hypothetical protein [Bacteroidales bacterium]
MEFLGNLRLKAGRMIIRRRTSPFRRIRQEFDLEKVKKVGILWDASSEKDFQHLAALTRQLSQAGKSVEVLVWIPGKTVPDRLTGITHMKFMKQSDLNWAFLPTSEDARNFISSKFDLLIDINPGALFQLMAIVSLSSSPMKVGPDMAVEPEKSPYDLMIRTPGPFSIATFIEQALLYLAMISTPETRA